MAKFATRTTRPATGSPIRSVLDPAEATEEGAQGYVRDVQSELFLLAVANMVDQGTFYESASDRDSRFRDLVHQATALDPEWTARFVGYLRGTMLMRSASVVAAAESVKARLDNGVDAQPTNRQIIASALHRADEPAEMLAYWQSRYGRNIPKPVKRGVADAVARLFTERAALRWDGTDRPWRLGDVIELVRPVPSNDRQATLWRWLLDRRHHPQNVLADVTSLPMLSARAKVDALTREHGGPAARAWLLEDPSRVAAAGMSWETLSGFGPMDAAAWSAVAPSMGGMALIRNLRNFDQAGMPDDVAAAVAAKFSDPAEVARSRQFPFRYLAAYRAVTSLRWGHALERALSASLVNVPSLPGRTLILVDQSGSMFWGGDARAGGLNCADQAAVFGAGLALRASNADLVQYGWVSERVPYGHGDALLRVVDRFHDMGGTNTESAVRRWYSGHDRVVVVTDEQSAYSTSGVYSAVPAQVPVYTWNLAGYRVGHAPSGDTGRHVFGGLTDAAFRMIPLLEAGRSQQWPF